MTLASNVSGAEDTVKESTYDFEGYTIEIEHTPGRSMYQAMEAAIRRLNDSLTYNAV